MGSKHTRNCDFWRPSCVLIIMIKRNRRPGSGEKAGGGGGGYRTPEGSWQVWVETMEGRGGATDVQERLEKEISCPQFSDWSICLVGIYDRWKIHGRHLS
ncbi:unnamed protein product [Laminaria digitata]